MGTTRVNLFLIVVATLLSACGDGGVSASNEADVPFTTVAKPCPSNVTVNEGVVARSQSEFTAVWNECFGVFSLPPAQPPNIDFDAVQVIGIFLGSRPNGCYEDSVSITRIRQTADRLIVVYKEEAPLQGACTQSVANPGHLVSTAKSELQVEFVAE